MFGLFKKKELFGPDWLLVKCPNCGSEAEEKSTSAQIIKDILLSGGSNLDDMPGLAGDAYFCESCREDSPWWLLIMRNDKLVKQLKKAK